MQINLQYKIKVNFEVQVDIKSISEMQRNIANK